MKYLIILHACLLFSIHQLAAQCSDPNPNIWQNTWQSCQASASPNPLRGEGHWIRYDLGRVYPLSKTHVWNSNELGATGVGFKNVVVDYSEDGQSWTELGAFLFPQGTGQARYGGFEGFDFGGMGARYVLITAIDNWGDASCYGLAEVKFNLMRQPIATPCDDPPCEEEGCVAPEATAALIINGWEALLVWRGTEEAEGYTVRYRPIGGDWIELEAEEEEYFLEDLTPGESYEFQVRSDCEEEESAYSEPFEFTMIAEQETCGLPLIMNFFIPDDEILWVTWNEVPDAESYRLRYRVADSGEDWVVTEVEDEIFAELEELENNTNYEFQVSVRCPGGWTDYSESEFFFMSTEDETVASDPSPAAFDFTFQLYPNPAQGAVNVVADLPRNGEVLLQLHDLMGRRLWRDRQQLAAGSQTLAYDWSELAAGVYFVKLRYLDSGQQLSQKLILF
ncbi:MAG: fibronectin type III domain-containing protein [Bacteroidota bacterium]